MTQTLQSSREKVEHLLTHHPELSQDDKLLWLSYLVQFYDLKKVLACSTPFTVLCDVLFNKNINSSTLIRVKQKFQQKLGTKTARSSEYRSLHVKSRIEHLLKNYPALKENDTQLWVSYLVMFHDLKDRLNKSADPYTEFCDIVMDREVPAISTMRRSRQRVQNHREITNG